MITEVEVDLLTALAGGQIAIKHLDDRALIVKIEPGEAKHGQFYKVISRTHLTVDADATF